MPGKAPKNLAEWQKAKQGASADTVAKFPETVRLFEQGLDRLLAIFEDAGAGKDLDRIWILPLIVVAHRLLLNALDLLTQRQIGEYYAVLRSFVELAADTVKMCEDPSKFEKWLSGDEATYEREFKPQFPRGHALTGPLYRAYGLATKSGSHSNSKMFLFSVRPDKVPGKGIRIPTKYFYDDDETIKAALVHLLEILRRYVILVAKSFAPLCTQNHDEKSAVWDAAVEAHRIVHLVKSGALPPATPQEDKK